MNNPVTAPNNPAAVCTDDDETKNTKGMLSCKLTTPELRQRKATVIRSLKRGMVQKRELKNGFAYRFAGTDEVVDELAAFIKTERACCSFFIFYLLITGDKSKAWLKITGPEGAKDFIKTELGL